MDFKKLAPWNWFKKEDEDREIAVAHRDTPSHFQAPDNRRDPFTAMERLFWESGLNEKPWSLLTGNLPVTPLADSGLLRPYVDIGASSKEYVITVEIPGVRDSDIKLEISDNTLIIKGEKQQEQKERNRSYYRVERLYGSFQRVLSLPEDADPENVQAIFKNGVLTITILRKDIPRSQSHLIPIKETK